MAKNLYLIFFFIALVGCGSESEPEQEETTSTVEEEGPSVSDKFEAYLQEAFSEEIGDEEHFYMFTTETMCALCKGNHFSSFKDFQSKLTPRSMTIISDFPAEKHLDSALVNICRHDSIGLFNHYSFPKSYLTVYRTENGKVDEYAFYKESEKFMEFMQKYKLISLNEKTPSVGDDV